jgi:hypothetical protein
MKIADGSERRQRMDQTCGLFIAGMWRAKLSGRDRQAFGPAASTADTDATLEAAEVMLMAWAASPASVRADAMRRIADEMRHRTDAAARMILTKAGKPVAKAGRDGRRQLRRDDRLRGACGGSNHSGMGRKGRNKGILDYRCVKSGQVVWSCGRTNLDAIAATPGLDGIYVGPAELSQTQGRRPPGFDQEETGKIAVLQTIVAACRKIGLRAGLQCGTPDCAARAIGWGFHMTTVGGDARFLSAAAGAAIAGLGQLTDRVRTKSEMGAY